MAITGDILIAGGYGVVGRRLATILEDEQPGRVIVGGRHPDAGSGRSRRIDVDDPVSIEAALDRIGLVVACVRQREPHLLRAAIRRGIAYTSIAPPWMPWPDTRPLDEEARRTGARVVVAAGLEPGISSVLARVAADELGGVDSIETALLLGLGDQYGSDSMAFILDEIVQQYSIVVDGHPRRLHAFEDPREIEFPDPVGARRAYAMPFRDQLYYPATLGARTAVARLALDPPWLAPTISLLLHLGLRRLVGRGGGRRRVARLIEDLRRRYSDCDRYALVVEVRRGGRTVGSTLVGRRQADATAVGVAGITEALWADPTIEPGVWLAEQIIDPDGFLAYLREHGLDPVTSSSLASPDRDRRSYA